MDADEFHRAIEEEAVLLESFGLEECAAKMRACTSLSEATEVHRDIEAMLRVAQMLSK